MKSKEEIQKIIQESIETKKKIPIDILIKASEIILDSYKKGGKILICGNGGSAADSQHMAGEFVNRFLLERKPMPCMALTVDSSVLTSIGNDYSFEDIFSKQVQAYGKPHDILIGISTSGNSKNIIKAVETAHNMGMRTICLLGKAGRLKEICTIPITIDCQATPRIQESHILIIHIISEILEEEMKKSGLI